MAQVRREAEAFAGDAPLAFILAVGASNVLLFGSFLVASLLGGPDLAAVSAPFLLLGAAFSVWGWRLVSSTRASARK